jgi:hypothetical protein
MTIDPTAPLFTIESLRFEDHDDDAANDLQLRLQALGEAVDVWVGQDLTQVPWKEPWELCWVLGGDGVPATAGISLRIGICWEEDSPWEERGFYVGVFFASVDAMAPSLGDVGGQHAADHDVPTRVRAILHLANADILPPPGPDWCLLDGPVGGWNLDTRWSRPATVTGDTSPDDNYRELRDQARQGIEDTELAGALLYFFPAEDVLGLNLQQVVEHLAPAFVFGKLAMEEITRPDGEVHPWVTTVRNGGRNPLLDLSAYPAGFEIEGMDPATELEWEMMMSFVVGFDGGGASEWPGIAWAHLFTRRREPGMGLAGVNELSKPLR